METLRTRLRAVVARQGQRIARIAGYESELNTLHQRVAELENEVQESRLLNQRLAELTDVVAEILVPAADRDDKKLAAHLATYTRTSF
jgi:hypothetical protein